jgi:transcriptional regulator with XRE-family HTH domain
MYERSRQACVKQGVKVETVIRIEVDMGFPERLAKMRKEKGLTQQALADLVGMHVIQIHRYESGSSQPTLEAIRKLALALSVTSDEIVFDTDERGPDDQLRLQFEALSRLDDREKEIVMEVLDGLLLKHDAKRWVTREKAS